MDEWDAIVETLGQDPMESKRQRPITIEGSPADPRLTVTRLIALYMQAALDLSDLRMEYNQVSSEYGVYAEHIGYLLRLVCVMIHEHREYIIHPDYLRLPEPLRKLADLKLAQLEEAKILENAPTGQDDGPKTPGYGEGHKVVN